MLRFWLPNVVASEEIRVHPGGVRVRYLNAALDHGEPAYLDLAALHRARPSATEMRSGRRPNQVRRRNPSPRSGVALSTQELQRHARCRCIPLPYRFFHF